MTINSFSPVVTEECTVLVLGTMPGVDSLNGQEYYAHKQNAFWFIMGECFGASFDLPYDERLQILTQNNIALWDVLFQCQREGSLDSKIRNEKANDIEAFIGLHKKLQRILFNGKKAEQLFNKYITLPKNSRGNYINNLKFFTVPSSSPAMAMLSKAQKLTIWKEALGL